MVICTNCQELRCLVCNNRRHVCGNEGNENNEDYRETPFITTMIKYGQAKNKICLDKWIFKESYGYRIINSKSTIYERMPNQTLQRLLKLMEITINIQ